MITTLTTTFTKYKCKTDRQTDIENQHLHKDADIHRNFNAFINRKTSAVPRPPTVATPWTSVIFVNENENGEKRENNEFVNKN